MGELEGGADFVHGLDGYKEETVCESGSGFGSFAHKEVIGRCCERLHLGDSMIAVVEYSIGYMVVHIVELTLALEK